MMQKDPVDNSALLKDTGYKGRDAVYNWIVFFMVVKAKASKYSVAK